MHVPRGGSSRFQDEGGECVEEMIVGYFVVDMNEVVVVESEGFAWVLISQCGSILWV